MGASYPKTPPQKSAEQVKDEIRKQKDNENAVVRDTIQSHTLQRGRASLVNPTNPSLYLPSP